MNVSVKSSSPSSVKMLGKKYRYIFISPTWFEPICVDLFDVKITNSKAVICTKTDVKRGLSIRSFQ